MPTSPETPLSANGSASTTPVDYARTSSVIGADGFRLGSRQAVRVEPYTFGQSEKLSVYALRQLERMHASYTSAIEAQSSLSLRAEITISIKSFGLHKYADAVADVPQQLHLLLFRAAPLSGLGLLGIDAKLALTAANLTLGGKGDAPKETRPLTRIETDLTAELFQKWLRVWCELWSSATQCQSEVVGQESEIDAIRICDSNTPVLKLELEVTLRKATGLAFLLVPLHMIAPMIEAMEQRRPSVSMSAPKRASSIWSSQYNHVPMPAMASVHAGRMTIGEFEQLKPGDVLPLPEGAMERALLCLAGKPVFEGHFGVDSGKLALSIDQKL